MLEFFFKIWKTFIRKFLAWYIAAPLAAKKKLWVHGLIFRHLLQIIGYIKLSLLLILQPCIRLPLKIAPQCCVIFILPGYIKYCKPSLNEYKNTYSELLQRSDPHCNIYAKTPSNFPTSEIDNNSHVLVCSNFSLLLLVMNCSSTLKYLIESKQPMYTQASFCGFQMRACRRDSPWSYATLYLLSTYLI